MSFLWPLVALVRKELIQALRDRCPETASILVTGHIIKGRMDLIRLMENAAAS